MNRRLVNETAFLTARHLLHVVRDCLRPEEQRDAFQEFYDLVKAGIERYESQADRTQRLKPSRN
jgi:hypothetical protein